MSLSSPFRGKWQCHDDTGAAMWTMVGQLGGLNPTPTRGTKLLLYKVGMLGSAELDIAALQPDGVTATNPDALRDSYLYPVPYSGAALYANGVGSTVKGAQMPAARFVFHDGIPGDAKNPPSFLAYDGPPDSLWGMWATGTGGRFWGWTIANVPPPQLPYSMVPASASAAHARSYLDGVIPDGADYTWVDLTDEDYTNITMRGVKFAGADLTRTRFTKSDLSHADFRGVHSVSGTVLSGMTLQGAIFAGVDLSGMDFTGSDLTGADFRNVQSLQGANFTNAILTDAHLENLDLTGMKFTGTKLAAGSYLDGTPAPPVHFDGASMASTSFFDGDGHPADLTGVDFTTPTIIQAARFGCTLLSSNFSSVVRRTNLAGVDFTAAVLKGTDFSGTDLRTATFSPTQKWSDDANHLTNLSGATIDFTQIGKNWAFMNLVKTQIIGIPTDLSYLNAQSSLMTNWELSNHDLGYATLSNTNLCGATLSYCNFTGAKMDGILLQQDESTTRSAVLTGSQMEDADLTGANLTGTTLSGVYLWGQKASISKATVLDTDFSYAYLTGMKFLNVNNNQCVGVNFDYACLINTDFTDTKLMTNPNGQPVHMHKTCLQGANFTNSELFGADLSAAAVDEKPGTFEVTIQDGWPAGKGVRVPLTYSTGTVGIEKATDSDTTCPAGSNGPCSGDALMSDQAPKTWPVHDT